MPSKQQHQASDDQENQDHLQLNVTIGRRVLLTLGQPRDIKGVQVRRLWENHYRVNIFVGMDVTSAKVAHSYFLVADGEGNILEADPKIAKQYQSVSENEIDLSRRREPAPPPLDECGAGWHTEPNL